MSVPTRVLENGQWVTRFLDPYQILARNRAQQEQQAEHVNEAAKAPCHAILTQTLVRSPVVKWILPARIRHPTKNDILFIGEDCVRIKEAHWNYTLDSVAVKTDFDAPIRSTRVFGLPRKTTEPQSIIKTENKSIWQDDIDAIDIYKERNDEYLNLDDGKERNKPGNGEQVFTTSLSPANLALPICADLSHSKARYLPPQMLVLVLESANIVFMYAISGPSSCVHLVASQRPLPHSTSRLRQLGEHLAVDPRSRALAVGAHETNFSLYGLKSRHQMQTEFSQDSLIMPIEAERAFTVDGIILHMEFLHPLADDKDHVLLMLIISKNGTSKLMWFEWNISTDLHEAKIEPAFSAFLIISESHVCTCRDILTGAPNLFSFELPRNKEMAEEVGDSRRNPIWIQWARPMRPLAVRASPIRSIDNIYLCREDGTVQYIDIKYDNPYMLDLVHNAGKLGVGINGSFAVVDLGPNANDLLVAGGDSGAGGCWRFSPRKAAERLSIQSNWTPLSDVILESPTNDEGGRNNDYVTALEPRGQQRLFVCSGKRLHGSVSEMDHGIQSSPPLESIDLGNEATSNILDMWILCSTEDIIHVLISYPTSSAIIRLQEGYDPELLDDTAGFDIDSKTIAAWSKETGLAYQVTNRSVTGISMRPPGCLWKHDFWDAGEEVLVASTGSISSYDHLIVAMRKKDNFFLRCGQLGWTYEPMGKLVPLTAQPTCINLHLSNERMIVVIGNVQGTLEVFEGTPKQPERELRKVAGWQFELPFEICDSLVVLHLNKKNKKSVEYLLICGLRNGHLHTLKLQYGQYELKLSEQIPVGHTSVIVRKHPSKPGRVVLYCGKSLYALDHALGDTDSHLGILSSIYLNDHGGSGMEQSEVFAFAEINWDQAGRYGADTIVAVKQGLLHFVKLQNLETRSLPLQPRSNGTPIRAIYSRRLRVIVALFSEMFIVRARKANLARAPIGKRGHRPFVMFLDASGRVQAQPFDIDAMELDGTVGEDQDSVRQVLSHKPGERFLGLIEWFPKVDDNEYHMLIFNTTIRDRQRPPSGRLLLYALSKAVNGKISLALKKVIETNSPVYSVIVHPINSAIIYCSGNDLILLGLDPSPSGMKFKVPCKTTMRSPGRHITMRDSYIYVSTANESLQVYRYVDDQLLYWHGDTIARNAICHMYCPYSDFILAADMAGSVTGLWQPSVRQANNALSTVFEAVLPRAITRLLRVSRPLWTHDAFIPDGVVRLDDTATTHASISASHPLATFDCRPRALLGASTDGTITQLLVMKKGWRLLKFVQRLCEQSPSICPFKTKGPKPILEPTTSDPLHMHIDGDILNRLFEMGADLMLIKLLDGSVSGRNGQERSIDCENAEQRWVRFAELSAEVLGQSDMERWEREKVLAEAVRWMRYVMRSAL